MGWWAEAQRAAAHEFGRRHYRGIAALLVARRALPPLCGLVVLAAAVGAVWWWYRWWLAHLLLVAPPVVAVALLVVGAAVWRRFGDLVEVYLPVAHPAVVLVPVALLGAALTAVGVWLG